MGQKSIAAPAHAHTSSVSVAVKLEVEPTEMSIDKVQSQGFQSLNAKSTRTEAVSSSSSAPHGHGPIVPSPSISVLHQQKPVGMPPSPLMLQGPKDTTIPSLHSKPQGGEPTSVLPSGSTSQGRDILKTPTGSMPQNQGSMPASSSSSVSKVGYAVACSSLMLQGHGSTTTPSPAAAQARETNVSKPTTSSTSVMATMPTPHKFSDLPSIISTQGEQLPIIKPSQPKRNAIQKVEDATSNTIFQNPSDKIDPQLIPAQPTSEATFGPLLQTKAESSAPEAAIASQGYCNEKGTGQGNMTDRPQASSTTHNADNAPRQGQSSLTSSLPVSPAEHTEPRAGLVHTGYGQVVDEQRNWLNKHRVSAVVSSEPNARMLVEQIQQVLSEVRTQEKLVEQNETLSRQMALLKDEIQDLKIKNGQQAQAMKEINLRRDAERDMLQASLQLELEKIQTLQETSLRRQAEEDLDLAKKEIQEQRIRNRESELERCRAEALTLVAKTREESRTAQLEVAKAREERAIALEKLARSEAEKQGLLRMILSMEAMGHSRMALSDQLGSTVIAPDCSEGSVMVQKYPYPDVSSLELEAASVNASNEGDRQAHHR
ncbi:hypothetical protein BCR41DRAFT_367607 [Lobosporangium transversale]|uniref:Uncharacterized protein n=1 Tax=Lobosporangium transversale TaxID=64571 RepID=A0A1Y2GY53_9FUNG|nr:hypothetical protein BCR41DRAFT_367607 [Lobosporangium transversale]ORZ27230.1 hypothetical protein BCR41DRAFT_367607 [Lobosporangium transversale]|eukprot:XP_021884957.1 hypothetical protein BCR41DRAFT_367607 [Lobosporangium transversale]